MSFDGYKVIACIPAGRQRTMSILMRHLRANSHILDGVQMWENVKPFDDHTATAQSDLNWIHSQADDFAVVMPLDDVEPPRIPKQLNTGRFYRNCTDVDTIYIRFDDDIVWIAPDAIENLVRYRIDHPEPLAVFANIWNNAVISAMQQDAGNITKDFGKVYRYCMDDVGWKSPDFVVHIHNQLLDAIEANTFRQFYLPATRLVEESKRRRGQMMPVRFSISCFAWHGSTMADHADHLATVEEEQYISFVYPNLYQTYNEMVGDALVSHYSFFAQRDVLDEHPHILDSYRELANDRLHDSYYQLLAQDREPYRPKVWWK